MLVRVLCLMHDMRHYGCAAAYLYEDNLGVHFSCVTSLGGPKIFRGFSTSYGGGFFSIGWFWTMISGGA